MTLSLETNPLREGAVRKQAVDPCAFVIFGATGSLTQRKLMPALFSLACHGHLPNRFAIIGVALNDYTEEQYHDLMRQAVEKAGQITNNGCAWDDFTVRLKYIPGSFDDPQCYSNLASALKWADKQMGTSGNRVIYLAVPPSGFAEIVKNLQQSGLSESDQGWTRIVVEKPFGSSLESAKRLDEEMLDVFKENQIYRIDHYLGKETVQNIFSFRFTNSILEPLWNQKYIDHIQITIAENDGIGGRGGYYDKAGALRDIIQNHGLQLLSLVAAEPPASLDPDAIRDEKLKVFKSIRRYSEGEVSEYVVRGQYAAGYQEGDWVPAYREESQVNPDSNTETFVALELYIDNWRWSGVPFYIRTGKRLARRLTEIAIQFRDVPDILFKKILPERVEPNVIVMRVQPDEGIMFRMESKVPGFDLQMRPVQIDFRYGSTFGAPVPEAYERLLLDIVAGDASLFARADGVEECWEILMPVLNAWETGPASELSNYLPGTWGPKESFDLLERSGRRWRRL